nr:hypothetical protein BaRGS_026810 [Batillaria attramentaria]
METSDVNMNTNKGANSERDRENDPVDLAELVTTANHKRYLQLVHTGSLSDDEEHHVKDTDDASYDNLSSPTSPTFDDSASAGEMPELSADPVERERQMNEWKEELEKVGPVVMVVVLVVVGGYQKTSAVVKTASEKTTTALSTVGAAVTRKIGDIKNSQTFKSMEERVETAYANVKTSRSIEGLKEKLSKVAGSKSHDDIDAAFQEATEGKESEAVCNSH